VPEMDAILVYDIGTTGLKCAAFSLSGVELRSATSTYRTFYPEVGRAEQDAEDFWTAAVEATGRVLSGGAVKRARILTIGLSGHMNGCLPVDGEGRPLCREIIHSDSRSVAECADILRTVPHETVYALTGNRVDEHLSLPKILWIKKNRPDLYRKTAFFLNSKDWLRGRLTGLGGQTDYSDASLVCAMDLRAGAWSRTLLKEVGLDPAKFPEIRPSAEFCGGLSREAARALGLAEGLPVVFGGGDAACATRGAGVTDTSSAYANIGSSAWISTLAEGPVMDPAMRMQNFCDLDGRKCNVCGTVQSAGIAVDWALSLISGDRAAMDEAVSSVPPGSDGILFAPYLMGERTPHWDANARGCFVGLSLYHGRAALIRAVYEGVAFALRDVFGIYRELGMSPCGLTLLGGGARSPVWRGIVAEVLGRPVLPHASPTNATCLGAAMAAGTGAGVWRSLDEAALIAKTMPEETPDPGRAAVYDRLYPIYSCLYERMKPIFDELALIRSF